MDCTKSSMYKPWNQFETAVKLETRDAYVFWVKLNVIEQTKPGGDSTVVQDSRHDLGDLICCAGGVACASLGMICEHVLTVLESKYRGILLSDIHPRFRLCNLESMGDLYKIRSSHFDKYSCQEIRTPPNSWPVLAWHASRPNFQLRSPTTQPWVY